MIELFPGYLISSYGHVFSKKRGKFLKSHLCKSGYLRINLMVQNKRKLFRIHQLVAMAHIPNIRNDIYINHKDGNKLNNSITNLEWCTASENQKHAWRTGLRMITPNLINANKKHRKLTFKDAQNIRNRYIPRCPVNGIRALAREYGVSKIPIQKILNNQTYISK